MEKAMDNKEMLDAVAKASGFTVSFDYYGEDRHARIHTVIGIVPKLWNPFEFESDAFHVAEDFDLIVDFRNMRAIESDRFYLGHRDWVDGSTAMEAIMRCAAKISVNEAD